MIHTMDRLPSRCGRDEGARSDNDPRIAGFIRTCAKDVDFLVFALRSICKFAFPLLSSVTVVFPEHERSQLEPLLRGAFPWVTVSGYVQRIPRCASPPSS